jgi:hypothetical protein
VNQEYMAATQLDPLAILSDEVYTCYFPTDQGAFVGTSVELRGLSTDQHTKGTVPRDPSVERPSPFERIPGLVAG